VPILSIQRVDRIGRETRQSTNGDQPGVRLKAKGRGGMSVEDLNASNDE
jgi:hypothetical protein